MKYYKCVNGKAYHHFKNDKIYPENYENITTVEKVVKHNPNDWNEVAKEEYLRQEHNSKQQRIERLEKELNELKKEIEQEQFKEDVWYNHTKSDAIAKYVGNNKGVGITGLGDWGESIAMNFPEEWREATKKEITQALDKERKRRGLTRHSFYKSLEVEAHWDYDLADLEEIRSKEKVKQIGGSVYYDEKTDTLLENGYSCPHALYHDGNWAETVQKNKVGEYDVKENNNGRIDIGCEINIKPSHLSWLKGICQRNNVMVYLDGEDVTNDIQNLKL